MRILVLTAMYPTAADPVSGSFVKEQVDSLIRAGVEVDVMAFDGARSFRNYLRAGLALRRRLRRQRYDLVHAHYGLTGLPARMQTRCPIVLTYHGSDLLGEIGPNGRYTLRGRFKVLLGQILGLTVTRCIVVADLLRARLWRRGAAVIPMGVDLELFRPLPRDEARRRLQLDPERRYVLFLANPENKVKRYDVARAAVDRLATGGLDVELLPVFRVAHAEVPWYMAACDVLVMTSNHEASPCVIKEALACNLPIVSVAVGDVPLRLAGVEGCYPCVRSPADVAAKLLLALEFGRRTEGRRKVAAISLDATARDTIAVFAAAIAKGS